MKENKVGYKDAFASKKWLRVRVKQIMGSMHARSVQYACILYPWDAYTHQFYIYSITNTLQRFLGAK